MRARVLFVTRLPARYAGRRLVFDLRRTSTVVSPRGRVHLAEDSGLATTCDIDLMGRGDWSDNVNDLQPDCKGCIERALMRPTRYFFAEVD
jgi:hypothetical protein